MVGLTTKDRYFMVKKTRQTLAYQICDQYADQNRTIHVLTLEPLLEGKIVESKIKNSSYDFIPILEPSLYNSWLQCLEESVKIMRDKNYSPVILCSEYTRRCLVRNALEKKFPEVAVLSIDEIDRNFSIKFAGIIEAKNVPVKETGPVYDMDILDRIEIIYNETHECGIENFKLEAELKDHLDHVSQKLGVSPLQAVLFSLFMSRNEDNCINMRDLANSANCSKFTIVKYRNEIDELEKKGLIRCSRTKSGISYRIPYEVVDSLIKNNEYTPAKTADLSIDKFFIALQRLFQERNNDELSFLSLSSKLLDLIKVNMHLQFCKNMMSYNLAEKDMTLLVCFCHLPGNYNDDDIRIPDFSFLFDDESEFHIIKRGFYNDTHLLIENKLIEHCSDINTRNSDLWRLTDRAKQELLEELIVKEKNYRKDLVLFENIKPKKMYYNQRETTAINSLTSLLQEENYQKILGRFESKGMRKGFTCLFSGGPGTGKTETVYQIARETKRNIMAVDISETRSCWFGESERKIKEIFNTYRKAVENSKIAPILLFNEADAVINKRNSSEYFVSQTENRIQNILLQEMENLSGIMIATSNLTENMDSAFERRFLYKITFDRPGIESRKRIWNALAPDMPEDKAIELSGRFDLSGGQIENIARKIEVNAILNGDSLTTETLVHYCKDEIGNGFNSSKKIGFASIPK